MKSNISRRTFLKYSLSGAGLTIAVGLTPFGWRLAKAAEANASGLKPFAYIEISPDNTVTVLVGADRAGPGYPYRDTHDRGRGVRGGLETGSCPSGSGSRGV